MTPFVRTIRIYQDVDFSPPDSLVLSEQAAHHLRTVLRLKTGQAITLFNGRNQQCSAIVESITRRNVTVALQKSAFRSLESPLSLHLGQALIKGERMEWLIQKSVELGVHCITPLITEYCAVKLDKTRLNKKIQQWQAIAISACEQCGRNVIPRINPPIALQTFIVEQPCRITKLLLDPRASIGLNAPVLNSDSISLIIGPEGGFSDAEIMQAQSNGFLGLSLGPRVLRTETAAIVSQTLLQGRLGDLYN